MVLFLYLVNAVLREKGIHVGVRVELLTLNVDFANSVSLCLTNGL